MEKRFVKCEVSDRIALVSLSNPPANSLTMEAYFQITDIFDDINERVDDVSVAIITGEGNAGFCSGRDVRDAAVVSPRKRQRSVREMLWSILECEVPVIGAIDGYCLGVGFAIASVCDMLMASEKAVFGLPEVDVGSLGGYKFIARVLPEQRARQMFFTAEKMDAQEAYRLGFVSKVVPADKLMNEAMNLARTITAKSPLILRMAKKSAIYSQFLSLKEGYRIEQNFTIALSKSEDAKEAAKAFMEKRAPVFKGR